MALALLGLLAVPALSAGGDDALLLGRWEGGDRASQARFGHLVLTSTHVRWSGSRANPPCKVAYRLIKREQAEHYPDALPQLTDVPAEEPGSPRYTVFRLALEKRACSGGRSQLQFAIPVATPARAELVSYDRRGQPVSWGHLERP